MPSKPLLDTRRVTLQLSNLCNMSRLHKKCPASQQKTKQILPAAVVYDILANLPDAGFGTGTGKSIAWHIYNEPMIDPRLMQFVRTARRTLPDVEIRIWTNGWYLNRVLFDEMIVAGVTRWNITGYTKAERARLGAFCDSAPAHVVCKMCGGELDDRMDWPEDTKFLGCSAPLADLCIYPTGHIGTCCFDTMRQMTYGDQLDGSNFMEVLTANWDPMRHTQFLMEGKIRCTDCGNCPGGR